ncbi:NADH:flavin oxidoreductase/NADH oxidase [Russula ochroleuca]|uniref:NADH:flavin oxidoreductase/NADH oxidase n=1 Tax=Russula ochroleuca TaxID=152965 RepID=A0A9P5TBE8_9AGAM|nr:NADH:flavin oxidoreductase/NADH oxidase [Russula ochroleuca]
MATSKLFQPIQVGRVTLQHRVVMAPLTRYRGNSRHTPTDLLVEHYAARGSLPGTLIISEATFIAPKASGYSFHVPGIWSDEQVAAWKKVTDAVHAKGSFMYLQLWALGRAASVEKLKEEDPSFEYVSAGDVPVPRTPEQEENGEDAARPRPLTKAEISEYVQLYATAAREAVERAGFDGVEIHGANGYLLDQFLKETSNNRTDEYGGSPENNARFVLDVAAAVSAAVGEERVGLRLSPWVSLLDNLGNNPIPVFSYLVTELRRRHPNFGYLHVVEPRVQGLLDRTVDGESNDFLRTIWAGKRWISAGGFSRENAIKQADELGELIAFGRYFTSNPDLPVRLRENIPLTPYNREVFYIEGSPIGYNDYFPADTSISVAA